MTAKPTPSAVRKAIDLMARLAAPTPRERAEQRFRAAKQAFHEATTAVMAREIGAAHRVDDALTEFNAARTALRGFDANEEPTPETRRMSTHPTTDERQRK